MVQFDKIYGLADDIVFKPFYETYGRHSVYLDVKLESTLK